MFIVLIVISWPDGVPLGSFRLDPSSQAWLLSSKWKAEQPWVATHLAEQSIGVLHEVRRKKVFRDIEAASLESLRKNVAGTIFNFYSFTLTWKASGLVSSPDTIKGFSAPILLCTPAVCTLSLSHIASCYVRQCEYLSWGRYIERNCGKILAAPSVTRNTDLKAIGRKGVKKIYSFKFVQVYTFQGSSSLPFSLILVWLYAGTDQSEKLPLVMWLNCLVNSSVESNSMLEFCL